MSRPKMSKKGGKRPAKTATAAGLVACSGSFSSSISSFHASEAGGHRARSSF